MIDRRDERVVSAKTSPDESVAPVPSVSLLVACREEAGFIRACLDSLLANDYPRDRLEILVMDGMSEDGTRAIVDDYARRYPFIRLLDNPRKITSAAFNLGMAHARGQAIILIGAHTVYSTNYVSGLMEWLKRSGADGVGGVCVTCPIGNSPKAVAIALGVSHPFGVGNAYFRTGASEPRWVDTIAFGCYRREVFDRNGLFDEDLIRNQDDEFNLRLIRNGGRLLLVPEIMCWYHARDSFKKLWLMYYQYGYFKPMVARKVGRVMTWRQLVPSVFIALVVVSISLSVWLPIAYVAVAATLGGYGTAVILASAWGARKYCFRTGVFLCAVFPVLHLSYGVGFLRGVANHLLPWRGTRKVTKVSITR